MELRAQKTQCRRMSDQFGCKWQGERARKSRCDGDDISDGALLQLVLAAHGGLSVDAESKLIVAQRVGVGNGTL